MALIVLPHFTARATVGCADGNATFCSPIQRHHSFVIPERIRTLRNIIYRILAKAVAIKGLSKSGRKKELPKTAKLTPVPMATKPAPTRAPVRLCVVEMGKPVTVAIMTVIAEPIATAVRNSGDADIT